MSSSVRPPYGGLASNAAAILDGVLKLLGVRFCMAIMEFADARAAFFQVLLLGAGALLASIFALLGISGMIVVLAWEALGWRIFLILFFAYLLLTIYLLWKVRNIIASGKVGLPLTLAELKKDRVVIFDEQGDPDCRA
jgi:uncharacterized membrane protein YqjE